MMYSILSLPPSLFSGIRVTKTRTITATRIRFTKTRTTMVTGTTLTIVTVTRVTVKHLKRSANSAGGFIKIYYTGYILHYLTAFLCKVGKYCASTRCLSVKHQATFVWCYLFLKYCWNFIFRECFLRHFHSGGLNFLQQYCLLKQQQH